MLVTLSGIIVFLHPTMSVFVDVSIMALQLLHESYTLLPLATFISARPLHNPYLEIIGCQLFTVYTVEKWIGIWLKGCGWWRFNVFNLCLHENVGGGCHDFSFECSRVVRPASCLRGSPWRQCQSLDIYQAMLSNCFWIHCCSKWCQQNVSRCRGWRIPYYIS